MERWNGVIVLIYTLLLLLPNLLATTGDSRIANRSLIHVHVVLNLNSSLGSVLHEYMRMAISDYYSAHTDHRTRLRLHIKNHDSLLQEDFTDLLNHEDKVRTHLGENILLPIMFFAARGSTILHPDDRYSVRATPDDMLQTKALAAICQGFRWPEVSMFFDDSGGGSKFLSHFEKALKEVEIGLTDRISFKTSVEDSHLVEKLKRLTTRQSRVFVVHMSPSLGYRFFAIAQRVGLMSQGFAWIITESLSNFMNYMDSATRDSMQGVLGIRPYVYRSTKLDRFEARWKRNMLMKNMTSSSMQLNVHGLWAYDAITALANAAERLTWTTKAMKDKSHTTNINIISSRLLKELSRTKFRGLTSEFVLVDRKLEQPAFEVFNVHGSGESVVGFWTPGEGIVREPSLIGQRVDVKSSSRLKNVMWPGECITKPKGWSVPNTGYIRAGLSWKLPRLASAPNNHGNDTGLEIHISLAAVKL